MIDKRARAVYRQQHEVVHGEAGQRAQDFVVVLDAQRAIAFRRRQRAIGVLLAAEPPRQRVGLQPRAAARLARRVSAVFRQQHADVHLVGFAFQPLEEMAHAVPGAGPGFFPAYPFGLAFERPVFLRGRQFAPRRVERDAALFRVLLDVVLAFVKARRLPRPHRAAAQGFRFVGHDQAEVDADHAPEAAAFVARAERRVEREQARRRFRVMSVAVGAVEVGGKAPHSFTPSPLRGEGRGGGGV